MKFDFLCSLAHDAIYPILYEVIGNKCIYLIDVRKYCFDDKENLFYQKIEVESVVKGDNSKKLKNIKCKNFIRKVGLFSNVEFNE